MFTHVSSFLGGVLIASIIIALVCDFYKTEEPAGGPARAAERSEKIEKANTELTFRKAEKLVENVRKEHGEYVQVTTDGKKLKKGKEVREPLLNDLSGNVVISTWQRGEKKGVQVIYTDGDVVQSWGFGDDILENEERTYLFVKPIASST